VGMLAFTGFLCGFIGGVFPLLKCFPVLFPLVFQFSLSNDSNRVEFISGYSASDYLLIFMFSAKA
jgi:hypothetical protein